MWSSGKGDAMSEHKHFISIWFFIGLLLGIYGLMILGAGIYDLANPAVGDVQNGVERNVMANLHMGIWWGMLMLALGSFYAVHFRPGKEK
jgi:hypothetical protein